MDFRKSKARSLPKRRHPHQASIYKFQTRGCIPLLPENIATLFEKVPIGTSVKIVYEPVLPARLPDGAY